MNPYDVDPGPKVKVWPVVGCALVGVGGVLACGSGWIVALIAWFT